MDFLMSATEFGDLAARMSAGAAGVRACLILSRDGLSLGAHPADEEGTARRAWDALEQLGDPRRGFVDMGTEIWVVSARGAYAAVIVAGPEAKPGLLLDHMESELAAADLMHPDAKRGSGKTSANGASAPVVDLPRHPVAPKLPRRRNGKAAGVDRVALAREFGRLMDDESAGGY